MSDDHKMMCGVYVEGRDEKKCVRWITSVRCDKKGEWMKL